MKEKPTVIVVVNQKGGTAKTTTVENLGIGLAREGKKVLLVDTDPQGSLTISLGYPRPDELEITLFDLLNKTINEDSVSVGEGILHQAEGIDLIPANISLAGLEVALVNTMNRERILKQFLEPVKGNYDYVLPAKAVHENQYGKGLWAKIPADGHTTLTKPYLAGQSEDGKNIWKDEKTTVSNRELKSMVEFYKKDLVPKYDIPEL